MKKPHALFLLMAGLLAMSSLFLAEEEDNGQALRCEMFQIYKDTNGEYGWPPASNPAAAKQCNQTEGEQ